jgi:hypothetical protein
MHTATAVSKSSILIRVCARLLRADGESAVADSSPNNPLKRLESNESTGNKLNQIN